MEDDFDILGEDRDRSVEDVLGEAPASASSPQWVSVGASSNVDAVAWWPISEPLGILALRFLNGGEYHYLDVPRATYELLLRADSPGEEMWAHVRRAGYTVIIYQKPARNWRAKRRP